MSGRDEGLMANLLGRLQDPNPAVWTAACAELGRMAARDDAAHEEVHRLLQSAPGEMRLKGMAALAQLAPLRPMEAQDFIHACLLETSTTVDVVQAEAIFEILWRLPESTATIVFEEAASNPHETIRAAAAHSLHLARTWPSSAASRLAHDPSALVQCSLALALAQVDSTAETEALREALINAEEDIVRRFMASLSDRAQPDIETRLDRRRTPRPDGPFSAAWVTSRIKELLTKGALGPQLVIDLEDVFREHPLDMAEILQPLLRHSALPDLVEDIAVRTRNERVAHLCRAMHVILSTPPSAEAVEDLLHALRGQRGTHAAQLVADVHQAAAARNLPISAVPA